MDAHPVPQNVTSFEFHLVGDMTLKQFGYLATGLIIAYITFLFFFNNLPYVATPIIAISAGLGAAFAFLPIYNRPLDHWVNVFFHAIFSPTQRAWRTPTDKPIPNDLRAELIKNRLHLFMQSTAIPQSSYGTPFPSNSASINLRRLPINTHPNLNFPSHPNSSNKPEPSQNQTLKPTKTGSTTSKMPTPEELNHLVEMARQTQMLQSKTLELEKELSQLKSLLALQSTKGSSPVQLSQTGSVVQQAGSQLNQLQKQAIQVAQQKVQPPIPNPTPPAKPPKVVIIEPPKQTKTVIALTSLPNIINGIITDTVGNYLENVIVIIHNQDNLPVRALKTNKLGQFTGATPLPSGVYTITMEKEGFDFDTLQITLNNQIVPPIKVTAKKGG